MVDARAIGERIRDFLLQKFPLARKRGLRMNDKLLEEGILDSLGVLDLVSFLEQEFAIQLSDDELLPENFQSVDRLADFVMARIGNNSNG